MRLIDADALKELFREVIGHIAKKPKMNGNLEHMIRASAMVIQMIDDAPSVQLNHNAEVSKMGIVHCEDCEHWDTSWETVYGLHYCPMIDMSTKKNFFCKYGAEKRGEIDETD